MQTGDTLIVLNHRGVSTNEFPCSNLLEESFNRMKKSLRKSLGFSSGNRKCSDVSDLDRVWRATASRRTCDPVKKRTWLETISAPGYSNQLPEDREDLSENLSNESSDQEMAHASAGSQKRYKFTSSALKHTISDSQK